MKRLILLTLLTGCGSESFESSKTPEPTEVPVIATPTPTPKPIDLTIVGNWIDAQQKQIEIKEDFTATITSKQFTWIILEPNKIIFSLDKIETDQCVYQVIPLGKFTTSVDILLNMICEKAGALSYKKK